ncbi:MAG TPA: mycofactocin biosynthesis peptidyl-dipeptidase MftE [Conexibacter sp.]|nr:mycofactocin biosynthesis peptidyl-dipeptidase MftE [Conexibacter sp.]
MSGAQLGDLPSPALDGAGLLAIPLGACEQHGPHLPLDTDTRIAVAVAERLAAARAGVLVAPALPYGSSGEHQDFPGTLSTGPDALRALLTELIRSATRTVARVLLVNAHGGNAAPLADVVAGQRGEGRDVRVWHGDLHGDAHAGRAETSALLALAPELVRLGDARAGVATPVAALLPRLRAEGVRAVSPNGVLGDPAGASASEGEALLARAADELTAMVDGWRAGDAADGGGTDATSGAADGGRVDAP